jgi:hypothetical protein
MSEAKIVIGATDNASRVLADVRSSMAGVERGAALLGNALGLIGIAGVGGLVATARSAINAVDAFNDLKDATGASIENISALDDVAARTGTSFDTVQTALVKLNQGLNAAKPGSDVELALNAIGLSAKQLKDLDPAEALLQTAKALSNYADDGSKARLTQELFGKSLKEVAPLLKDLAEQGQLNAKVTTEQAEAAEKFNKELYNLQKNSTDTARAISLTLIASINETIAAFREGAAAGKSFLAIANDRYWKNIGEFYGVAADGADSYRKRLAEIDTQLKGGESRLLVRNALLREQATLQKKLAAEPDYSPDNQSAAEMRRLSRKTSVGDFLGGAKTKAGKAQTEQITDAQRALASYVNSLERVSEKTQDLTEAQKALDFLKGLGTQGEIPQVRELVLGLAERIDKEKELAEILKTKRLLAIEEGDAVQRANDIYQQRLKSLLDATPTAILQQQRDDVRQLTDEYEAGRLSEELYLEAVSARLDLTNDKTKEAKNLADELGLSFTSAFEDAIVGGKGLQDVLKGLEQDILRIVTRKVVTEPAGDALTSFIKGMTGSSGGSSSGSGFGDIFSKIFSFDGGGYTGSGTRSGGLDGKGGFMAMLHPQESVLDHTKGQSAGNVVNITVAQSFAAGTDRRTILQAAADASRQLQMAGRNL